MKELEISAKTVEDALAVALLELGVSKDQVEIEVIKKGRAGIFGVGAEDARIRVRVIECHPKAPTEPSTGQKGDNTTNTVEHIAVETLKNLLELMNVKAQVRSLPSDSGAGLTLDIQGKNLSNLIGRRGQTLASLQFLTRLIVSERTGKWPAITVDVAGYKQQRRESLRRLALSIAEQVKSSKKAVAMEPMPPDERRIVHLTLANHPDVTTHSVGQGEQRKVIIQPKKR